MFYIELKDVKLGDLIFFYLMYDVGIYVIYVGIYVGDNWMFYVGDFVGWINFIEIYW